MDASYLASLIRSAGVTTAHFVPSMLGVFVEEQAAEQCESFLRVICSGEALSPAKRFRERLGSVELHNLYGPTEAAVDVTAWAVVERAPEKVLIGRPLSM